MLGPSAQFDPEYGPAKDAFKKVKDLDKKKKEGERALQEKVSSVGLVVFLTQWL